MQTLLSILFVASLALATARPAQAEAQGATFTLNVCNKYSLTVLYALFHVTAPGETRHKIRGWLTREPDECGKEQLPHGPWGIFAFAITDRLPTQIEKRWDGGGLSFCVPLARNFDTVVNPALPASHCTEGEVLLRFDTFSPPHYAVVTHTFR